MHSTTMQPPAAYRNHVLSTARSPFRMNTICKSNHKTQTTCIYSFEQSLVF